MQPFSPGPKYKDSYRESFNEEKLKKSPQQKHSPRQDRFEICGKLANKEYFIEQRVHAQKDVPAPDAYDPKKLPNVKNNYSFGKDSRKADFEWRKDLPAPNQYRVREIFELPSGEGGTQSLHEQHAETIFNKIKGNGHFPKYKR